MPINQQALLKYINQVTSAYLERSMEILILFLWNQKALHWNLHGIVRGGNWKECTGSEMKEAKPQVRPRRLALEGILYLLIFSQQNGSIMLIREGWKRPEKVNEQFNCSILCDFPDLYLKTNTIILLCFVEELRTLSYSPYGSDSAPYFTCSYLFGDAFLKNCRPDSALLNDGSHRWNTW